jgi:V/A-type H+-transporting ATPase subunit D
VTGGAAQVPTRSALLALREERVVVGEAYEFLDEKRLLLAVEILRQLRRYETLVEEAGALADTAARQLAAAVCRHGLEELSVYPACPQEQWRPERQQRNFMGVTLVETRMSAAGDPSPPIPACFPSRAAEQCRQAFQELVARNGELAGVTGNLYRLMTEYRLTERRARALENIILPEIEQELKEMSTHLEEMELEDAIRVRLRGLTR